MVSVAGMVVLAIVLTLLFGIPLAVYMLRLHSSTGPTSDNDALVEEEVENRRESNEFEPEPSAAEIANTGGATTNDGVNESQPTAEDTGCIAPGASTTHALLEM